LLTGRRDLILSIKENAKVAKNLANFSDSDLKSHLTANLIDYYAKEKRIKGLSPEKQGDIQGLIQSAIELTITGIELVNRSAKKGN